MLDEQFVPKPSSQLKLIKMAVWRQPHYKQMCADVVRTVRDTKALGRPIADATDLMSVAVNGDGIGDQAAEAKITEVFANFNMWRSRLRPGALDSLQDLLALYLQNNSERLCTLKPTTETLAFAKLLSKRFDGLALDLGPASEINKLRLQTSSRGSVLTGALQATVLSEAATAYCVSQDETTVDSMMSTLAECECINLDTAEGLRMSQVLKTSENALAEKLPDHSAEGFLTTINFRLKVADMCIKLVCRFPNVFQPQAASPMALTKAFLDLAALRPTMDNLIQVADIRGVQEKLAAIIAHSPERREVSAGGAAAETPSDRIEAAYDEIVTFASGAVCDAATKCITEAVDKLQPMIDHLEAIASGCEHKDVSWKDDLEPRTTWKKVVEMWHSRVTDAKAEEITKSVAAVKKVGTVTTRPKCRIEAQSMRGQSSS
jgi:hypothetical protein